MTRIGASQIVNNIDYDYTGKISFSGFGENLLNPEFPGVVAEFRRLVGATLECNTNGDKLTESYAYELFDMGLDFLYINLYDGIEQMDHFDEIMKNVPKDKYKYRMHWSQADHGLILNNRSGTIDWVGIDETDISTLQGKPCHYPFYKMFVDWNGDILFCSNDWGREHVVANLMQQSLMDAWFSKPMTKIRNRLMKGDRSQSPCDKCSVDGSLFGQKSFDLIKEYYENIKDLNHR